MTCVMIWLVIAYLAVLWYAVTQGGPGVDADE